MYLVPKTTETVLFAFTNPQTLRRLFCWAAFLPYALFFFIILLQTSYKLTNTRYQTSMARPQHVEDQLAVIRQLRLVLSFQALV